MDALRAVVILDGVAITKLQSFPPFHLQRIMQVNGLVLTLFFNSLQVYRSLPLWPLSISCIGKNPNPTNGNRKWKMDSRAAAPDRRATGGGVTAAAAAIRR